MAAITDSGACTNSCRVYSRIPGMDTSDETRPVYIQGERSGRRSELPGVGLSDVNKKNGTSTSPPLVDIISSMFY